LQGGVISAGDLADLLILAITLTWVTKPVTLFRHPAHLSSQVSLTIHNLICATHCVNTLNQLCLTAYADMLLVYWLRFVGFYTNRYSC